MKHSIPRREMSRSGSSLDETKREQDTKNHETRGDAFLVKFLDRRRVPYEISREILNSTSNKRDVKSPDFYLLR